MAARKETVIVEIGGAVAPLLDSVVQTINIEFSKIGDSLSGLKKQQNTLEKFDPSQLRKAGAVFLTLKAEVGKLELAFESLSGTLNHISRNLRSVRTDIYNATAGHKNLSEVSRKTQSSLTAIKGIGKIKLLGKALASSARSAKKFAAGIGLVGSMGAELTNTNVSTAAQAKLAKSLGISGDALTAWSSLAKEAGLGGDSFGGMMKHLTTKIGESKKLGNGKPFGGALEALGLSFNDLEKMTPEQQFKTIASSLKNLDDVQLAQSLSQKIFAGDAGQFFGHLRTLKGGIDDIYSEQVKLNMLTDEGSDGAEKYAKAMSRMGTVVSTAKEEFCGLIGGALEPYVATLAPQIGALFNEHRDDIKKFGKMLGEALPKIGEFAFTLLNVLTSVGSTVLSVADAIGGFGVAAVVGSIMATKFAISGYQMFSTILNIGKAVAPLASGALPYLSSMFMSVGTTISSIASTVFPALIAGIKAVGLAVMSNPIIAVIGLAVLAVGRLIYAWDELKKSFKEGGILGAAATFFGIGGDDEEEEKKAPVKRTLIPPSDKVPDEFVQQPSEVDGRPVAFGIEPPRASAVTQKTYLSKHQLIPYRGGQQSASNRKQSESSKSSVPANTEVIRVGTVPSKKNFSKAELVSSGGKQQGEFLRQQSASCHSNKADTGGEAARTVNARSLKLMAPPSSKSVESRQNVDNRTITINVHATEGQSPKEIAQETCMALKNKAVSLYDEC